MDPFEIPGNVRETILRFEPAHDDKTLMTLRGPGAGGHSGVILDPSWVLPLAAWFAGEAQPVVLGDRPGTLYGCTLDVRGDEYATIWGTHTWARLDCLRPFGTARVVIGPRGKFYGCTVMLLPEGRMAAAEWLRRADTEGWTRRKLTA